jgi:hypothetical protein
MESTEITPASHAVPRFFWRKRTMHMLRVLGNAWAFVIRMSIAVVDVAMVNAIHMVKVDHFEYSQISRRCRHGPATTCVGNLAGEKGGSNLFGAYDRKV